MLLRIGGILSEHEVGAIVHALEQAGFEDGRRTAGWHAREVKRNEQATPSPALDGVLAKVREALLAHEVFMAAARPKSFVKLLASRYAPDPAESSDALILHGVYDLPRGVGVDEGTLWGDYFYLEALMRVSRPEWTPYW